MHIFALLAPIICGSPIRFSCLPLLTPAAVVMLILVSFSSIPSFEGLNYALVGFQWVD